MKITIITVTYNSQKTILDTLNSVQSQTYPNIEHILVDGGSDDKTLEVLNKYKFKKKKIFKKKNYGLYQSINFAINKSSGDYIIILNSDDIFQSNLTIEKYAKFVSKNKKIKIFFGDIIYFKNNNYNKIVRNYSGANFKLDKMRYGIMPPHPSSLISKEIYIKYGFYNEDYNIASDFDLFLKFLFKYKISFKYYNSVVTRMRVGGISTKNFYSHLKSTFEIYKSFKKNKIKNNFFLIFLRLFLKIPQLYFYNEKKLNKNFKIFKIKYNKKYYLNNTIKITNNYKKILSMDNFVYSALNLAFLGYLANKKIIISKNLYVWCDGIFASKMFGIDKMPGREILKKLFINKNIKNIHIIGDLSKKSKNFLKKYNLKIINTRIKYGPFDKIKRNIKLSKSSIVLITLPTPKQEQFANYLVNRNKNYKIICIGASIRIVSGDEKQVPDYLKKFEFIWRLKYDTIRRLIRIIETLFFFLKGKFLNKTLNNFKYIQID